MSITYCHLIGLIAFYVGVNAILKKEIFISPVDEAATEENKTYIRGVIAVIIGLMIVLISAYYLFFKEGCASIL